MPAHIALVGFLKKPEKRKGNEKWGYINDNFYCAVGAFRKSLFLNPLFLNQV
jgi:hypothetical protein